MLTKCFHVILATMAAGLTTALAQDSKQIPPPSPPFVAAVPENADWIVTLQYPGAPQASASPGSSVSSPRRTTAVHSTKTGNLKHDRITATDGSSEDHWYSGSLYLWPSSSGQVIVFDTRDNPRDAGDTSPSVASGFPGVGWVQLSCYDKVEPIKERPCYHYIMKGGAVEAWIDVETRFPLAYKCGDVIYQFKFNAPPTAPLTLPPAYQKALDYCQKELDHRAQLAKDLGRKQ